MAERDFDNVALDEENDSKAVIQVGLESFSSKNEVSYSFTNGGLKIAANVDGKVYSKTIKGLTDKNVAVEIKKSSGSFKVILKKKQSFSLQGIFWSD